MRQLLLLVTVIALVGSAGCCHRSCSTCDGCDSCGCRGSLLDKLQCTGGKCDCDDRWGCPHPIGAGSPYHAHAQVAREKLDVPKEMPKDKEPAKEKPVHEEAAREEAAKE
jgi:hypothetical protein